MTTKRLRQKIVTNVVQSFVAVQTKTHQIAIHSLSITMNRKRENDRSKVSKVKIYDNALHVQLFKETLQAPVHTLCWESVETIMNENNTLIATRMRDDKEMNVLHYAGKKTTAHIVTMLLQCNPNAIRNRAICGNYPLHCFISIEYIYLRYRKQSNDLVLKVIELFPTAVQECNNSGNYPLHLVLECQWINDETILRIIELYPPAVQMRCLRGTGIYPLALAINSRKSEAVLLKLLELYPAAIQEKSVFDYNDYYPFNWACEFDYYPLHCACVLDLSEKVIMKLIELFPAAAQQRSSNGGFPLHLACRYGKSENVILKLIEVYPEAAAEHIPPPLTLALGSRQSDTVIRKLEECMQKEKEKN